MQSVSEVIMSKEEVSEMLRNTLKEKGLIGPGNTLEFQVLDIDRREGSYVFKTLSTPPKTLLEPLGPTPRGDVLLCDQTRS